MAEKRNGVMPPSPRKRTRAEIATAPCFAGLLHHDARPREATSVAIAGDWNGWTAFPLRREASGRWSIELQLEPGVYKYSLLVDDQLWTIPEGAPTLPDEFGGEVGLLIVR